VLRYDVTGYGRSGVTDSLISPGNELAALLDTLGIEKAVIVGMSMGGAIAIDFVLEHPEKAQALITVSSQLNGYRLLEPTPTRLRRMLTLTKDSGLAVAKEAWLHDPFLTPLRRTAPVKAKIRQIVSEWTGAQFMRSTFAHFLPVQPPAIERLEQIKIPTLAIVGEHDDPNMLAIADTIAARVPRGQKHVVPGCGHLTSLERPEEFNRLVLDFLSAAVKR
jgi:pimeloyl-ACP methyl ester carboxylesterase